MKTELHIQGLWWVLDHSPGERLELVDGLSARVKSTKGIKREQKESLVAAAIKQEEWTSKNGPLNDYAKLHNASLLRLARALQEIPK